MFLGGCCYLLAAALTLNSADPAHGQPEYSFDETNLRVSTKQKMSEKTTALLRKYCPEACELLDVKVVLSELEVDLPTDLGFSDESQPANMQKFYVERVLILVQVDERVTRANRSRLEQIVLNHVSTKSAVELTWRTVQVPQIGRSLQAEEIIKRSLEQSLRSRIEGVFQKYCPDRCLISAIFISGQLRSPDQALSYDPRELRRSQSGNEVMKVDSVEVDLVMDDSILPEKREAITKLIEAKTGFVRNVRLNVASEPFPETAASERQKLLQTSEDPYGLEKLRRTLEIFRELAGTKEIITQSKVETSNKDSTTTTSATSKEFDQSESLDLQTLFLYAMGGLGILGLVLLILFRYGHAKKDAEMMIKAMPQGSQPIGGQKEFALNNTSESGYLENSSQVQGALESGETIGLKITCDKLKKELLDIFVESPKVAQETFSRLLQEEGVEVTAKYIHIFGHIIVFELIDDPNLDRELYALSEYYHNSQFLLSFADELDLLRSLKRRVTASEIRVLAGKSLDKFDFLHKMDPSQVFNLIQDENPQVQGIVLTQLDPRQRRTVFEHFEGQGKINLMRELCRADALPREYLLNVAQALEKKTKSSPMFDTTQLRISDVLLELLERSSLDEQRALMRDLIALNPESARAVKLKLVTVEILPFLKDGQLLEVVLGMKREDLLIFLKGTREHIQGLLLSKAPPELAQTWYEDLQTMAGIDEKTYRIVEMSVLNKIRNFAKSGNIGLIEINDRIFGDEKSIHARPSQVHMGRAKIVA